MIERFSQMLGNLAATFPEVLKVPNMRELLREYADQLNVPAVVLRSREEVEGALQAEQEQLARQQAALEGETLAKTAQTLAETEVLGP